MTNNNAPPLVVICAAWMVAVLAVNGGAAAAADADESYEAALAQWSVEFNAYKMWSTACAQDVGDAAFQERCAQIMQPFPADGPPSLHTHSAFSVDTTTGAVGFHYEPEGPAAATWPGTRNRRNIVIIDAGNWLACHILQDPCACSDSISIGKEVNARNDHLNALKTSAAAAEASYDSVKVELATAENTLASYRTSNSCNKDAGTRAACKPAVDTMTAAMHAIAVRLDAAHAAVTSWHDQIVNLKTLNAALMQMANANANFRNCHTQGWDQIIPDLETAFTDAVAATKKFIVDHACSWVYYGLYIGAAAVDAGLKFVPGLGEVLAALAAEPICTASMFSGKYSKVVGKYTLDAELILTMVSELLCHFSKNGGSWSALGMFCTPANLAISWGDMILQAMCGNFATAIIDLIAPIVMCAIHINGQDCGVLLNLSFAGAPCTK